jgi:hypothetical protein
MRNQFINMFREKGSNLSFLIFLIFILVSPDLYSQHLSPDKIKRYTTADGLPSNNILCMDQDREGNLWIGTEKGASKFDGRYFTNYAASNRFTDREVWAILCDTRGSIWCATEKGLYRFSNQTWKRYDGTMTGLGTDWFSRGFFCEDNQGYTWGGAHKSVLFKFYSDKFETLNIPNSIGIVQDKNANLFVLTWSSLYQIAQNRSSYELINDKLYKNYGTLRKIVIDRNNHIWIGADSSLVKSVDGGNTFQQYKFDINKTGKELWDIFIDKNGQIWSAHDKAVAQFDLTNFNYYDDELKTDGAYHYIFEDRQSHVWFCSSNGLAKFDIIRPKISIRSHLPDTIKSRIYTFQFKGDDGKFGSPDDEIKYEIKQNENAWETVINGIVNLRDLKDNSFYRIKLRVTDRCTNVAEKDTSFYVKIDKNIPIVKIKNQDQFSAPIEHHTVKIEFIGEDDQTPPDELQFSYKYEKDGTNIKDWQKYERRTRVMLQDLRAGEHTFFIKAKDEGQNESEVTKLIFRVEQTAERPDIAIKNLRYHYFSEKNNRPVMEWAPIESDFSSGWISFFIDTIDYRPEKRDLTFSYLLEPSPYQTDWTNYQKNNHCEIQDLPDGNYHLKVRAKDKAGFVSKIIDTTFAVKGFNRLPKAKIILDESLGTGKIVGKIVKIYCRANISDCLFSVQLDSLPWSEFQQKNRFDFQELDTDEHTVKVIVKNKFGIDPSPEIFEFFYERIKNIPIIWFGSDIPDTLNTYSVPFRFSADDDQEYGDRTPSDSLRYSYRLIPRQKEWSEPNYGNGLVEYDNLENGSYFFQVKALDKSDNESIPAEHFFTILVIPFYKQAWFIILGSLASVILAAAFSIAFTLRRTKGKIYKQRYNPYIVGEAVHDPEMYFGRQTLMQDIFQSLKSNSLCLTGERRIGKTTVLEHIDKNTTKPLFSFFCNLESVKVDFFFSRIMQHLTKKIESIWPNPSLNLLLNRNENQQYDDLNFEEDIEIVLQFLRKRYDPDVSIIMLLDEIDATQTFPPEIHQSLRNVFQTYKGTIRMVAAGVSIRKGDWRLPTSPWYNFFEFKEVTAFKKQDSELLITKPVKGFYVFDKSAVDFILAKTDGKPYYIQSMCKKAITKILNDKRKKVRFTDVNSLYEDMIRLELNREFELFWEDLSKKLQQFIIRAVKGENISLSAEQKQEIHNNDYNFGHRVIKIVNGEMKFSTIFRDWLKINYV